MLDPEALEAARLVYGGLTECEGDSDCDECQVEAGQIIRAYLAVAQPSARHIELIKRLTTERDRARQGLNDQRREFRRLRESDLANGRTHPVVNSVEELDKLPDGTIVKDSEGEIYIMTPYDEFWRVFGNDMRFSSGAIALPARVLHLPEVKL